MAKCRNVVIPHNVKERFRHQNLQRVLEHVANHVPQMVSDKKETKAKKLKRIVLYMKYLLWKKKRIANGKTGFFPPKVLKSSSEKNKANKAKTKVEAVSHKAQIVFLKKFSQEEKENLPSFSQIRPAHYNVSETPNRKQVDLDNSKVDLPCKSVALTDKSPGFSNQHNHPLNARAHKNVTHGHCVTYPLKQKHYSNNAKLQVPKISKSSTSSYPAFVEDVACNTPATADTAERFGFPEHFKYNRSNPYHEESCHLRKSTNLQNRFSTGIELKAYQNSHSTMDTFETVQNVEWNKERRPLALVTNYQNGHGDNPNMEIKATENAESDSIPESVDSHPKLLLTLSETQDNLPLDLISSSESAPITSSNEWISSDETEGDSHPRNLTDDSLITDTPDRSADRNINCDTYSPNEMLCDISHYLMQKSDVSNLDNHGYDSPRPYPGYVIDPGNALFVHPMNFRPVYYGDSHRPNYSVEPEDFSVPHESSNAYDCRDAQFGNSFHNVKSSEDRECGEFTEIQIKQESEGSLLAEEISYSLNSLNQEWSGGSYFNVS